MTDTINQSLGQLREQYVAVVSRVYYVGETSIKGVLPNEILADKISAMSSDAIYKHRTKDIVDVYALAHCVKAKREIQPFTAFYDSRAKIEHAYNALKGIGGKPGFSAIYAYLSKFVQPFVVKDYTNKTWDSKSVC